MAKRKPSRFRNTRRYYVYHLKKSKSGKGRGRQVSNAYARSHRKCVVRVARYTSTLTGRPIRAEKANADAQLQAIAEVYADKGGSRDPRVRQIADHGLSKGQEGYWKYILGRDRILDEYRSQANNYQRWFLALWKEDPDIFKDSPKFGRYVKRLAREKDESDFEDD